MARNFRGLKFSRFNFRGSPLRADPCAHAPHIYACMHTFQIYIKHTLYFTTCHKKQWKSGDSRRVRDLCFRVDGAWLPGLPRYVGCCCRRGVVLCQGNGESLRSFFCRGSKAGCNSRSRTDLRERTTRIG